MFFLDFDGVMANAEVYLNGKKIGERPYGYISFRVNLTPYIRFDSENIIAVRVDTEKLVSRSRYLPACQIGQNQQASYSPMGCVYFYARNQ